MPLKGLGSTCIVEGPEIVRAPLVVKVPVTSGNVEKSYTAVMVTGVGGEADAEGAEPIVKKAIIHSAIAAEKILLCRIISILFFVVNCWFEVMFLSLYKGIPEAVLQEIVIFLAACLFRAILLHRLRENSARDRSDAE